MTPKKADVINTKLLGVFSFKSNHCSYSFYVMSQASGTVVLKQQNIKQAGAVLGQAQIHQDEVTIILKESKTS